MKAAICTQCGRVESSRFFIFSGEIKDKKQLKQQKYRIIKYEMKEYFTNEVKTYIAPFMVGNHVFLPRNCGSLGEPRPASKSQIEYFMNNLKYTFGEDFIKDKIIVNPYEIDDRGWLSRLLFGKNN